MVEVFKTNIQRESESHKIERLIREHYPDCQVDFDLEDCDKILRIDISEPINDAIRDIVESQGYYCEELT